MNIITLTLSPAYDVHCRAEGLKLHHENFATVMRRDAGGKGVNISRALTQNGVQNCAVVALGAENAADFRASLDAFGMSWIEIPVAGRIRENYTFHTPDGRETRISFPGAKVDAKILDRVEEVVSATIGNGDALTLTGRLPDGLQMADIKAFLRRMQAKGARVVIDSRSFSLSDLCDIRPWLIKPNEEEIALYLGQDSPGFDAISEGARRLQQQGIQNVMVSLGSRGALLMTDGGAWIATPPRVAVCSTIGAGDSSIAGFLAATGEGKAPAECLATAIAFGSAACMNPGTEPPRDTDVAEILKWVKVEAI